MAWLGLLGLLFMIIPLAYVLASLVGLSYLWYRVLKSKRQPGGDMAACARCGYAVRGLAGLNCPECGADLREVGIVTPAQRGAVSPVLFVLLWTLLLPGPSCLVSGILVAVGPKTSVMMNDSLTLNSPASGEYQYIELDHYNSGVFMGGGFTMSSVMVQGNAQQYESLDIDAVAMTYEDYINFNYTPQNQTPPTKPLDRQALLDLMQRAGADPTLQDVIDEADELLGVIKSMPTLGLGNVTSSRFTPAHTPNSIDQPAGWFMLLLLVFWLVAWVAGLVIFFRIRKKHMYSGPHTGRRDPPRFAPPGGLPPSTPSF